MRLIDVVRALGPLTGLIVAIVLAPRRQIFRRLRAAGATGPDAAQPIKATGLSGFWRRRLLAAGVLRTSGGDRYWLDVDTWRAYQRRRQIRGLTIFTILAATALAVGSYALWH